MSQLTGASYSPQTKIILHKNTANPNINCIHSNAVVIAERIGWQHFHLKKEFVKKLQICFTIYFEEVSGETPRCITIHHHYLCIIFSIGIDNGDDNLEGFRDCGQSSS